jgi:hypothetical protein
VLLWNQVEFYGENPRRFEMRDKNEDELQEYFLKGYKEEALRVLIDLRLYKPSYYPRFFESNLITLKKCIAKGVSFESIESDANEIASFEKELQELNLSEIPSH